MNARPMRWAVAAVVVGATLCLPWGGGTKVFASPVITTPDDVAVATEEVAAPEQASTQYPDFEGLDLSLAPAPIRPMSDFTVDVAALTKEQALIPLPPAAWTGLSGLAAAGLIGSFRTVRRFLLP